MARVCADDHNKRVESESEDLKRRVESVVEMALATMRPLSLAFVGQGLDQLRSVEVAVT